MPLSRRYTPEISPGEASIIGMDFSYIVPPGVGLSSGTLQIFTNTTTPTPAPDDFVLGPVSVADRTLYADINALGAATGKDYQLRWVAIDTTGHVWPRTALLLCAYTS